MLLINKISQKIGHLFLKQATISKIQHFQNNPSGFSLINFGKQAQRPSGWSSFFKQKIQKQLLDLYLNFLQLGESNPKQIASQFIQPTLKQHSLKWIKSNNAKIHVQKCQVLQSDLLQRCEFQGVFIHRKYNLNQSSYDIRQRKQQKRGFQIKKILSQQAQSHYDKLIKQFKKDGMKQLYYLDFQNFINEKVITRQLYLMLVDLVVKVQSNEGVKKFGQKGPTLHLLQIESLINPYSNLPDFYLCDFDFMLKGNYHLKSKL